MFDTSKAAREFTVCVLALWASLGSIGALADSQIQPRGSRFAAEMPNIKDALSQGGYALTPDDMERALQSSSLFIRWNALWGLAATGSVGKATAMKRLLTDEDLNTRMNAIYSLSDLSKRFPEMESVVPRSQIATAARSIFAEAQSDVTAFGFKLNRVSAAKMLLEVADDPSGYPVVLESLAGPDKSMRAYAVVNTQLFATRGVRDENGKAVDWLAPLAAIVRAQTSAEVTRVGAVSVLIAIGSPQARATLIELSKTVQSTRVREVITAHLARPTATGVARSSVFRGDG